MGDTLAQAGLLTPITINTWARLRTADDGHLDELASYERPPPGRVTACRSR